MSSTITTTPKPNSNAALIAAQVEIDNYFKTKPQDSAKNKVKSLNPQLNTEYNDKYDFSVNKFDQEITTNDVYERDLNTALNQQNALYIAGTITCATLLITALLIAR
jgi:hypothetical protein